LDVDALESSHPISVEVYHPDEIMELFDTITYLKGSSVIWKATVTYI
jgi:aminopeptidase N